MIKVLFVCHGNICRSPMAEYMMRDLIHQKDLSSEFYITSAATSREEIGNSVHPGAKAKLAEENILCGDHRARQLTADDYAEFDLIIGMDSENIHYMNQILRRDPDHKIYKLLQFANSLEDIADPWYTGNFDKTYQDIKIGTTALLEYLQKSM